MIQTLIFDFDGLILDTETLRFESWRETYRAHGLALELEDWLSHLKTRFDFDPHEGLEALLGRKLDREPLAEKRRDFSLPRIEKQDTLPGVREYIADALQMELKLGVASGSTRSWVTGHLTRLGLIDFFQAIRCRDDVEAPKPDPAVYTAVLQALDTYPDQALALEDSPVGIHAATAAGLRCVAVPNELTRHLNLDHAHHRINSLADLSLETLLARISLT